MQFLLFERGTNKMKKTGSNQASSIQSALAHRFRDPRRSPPRRYSFSRKKLPRDQIFDYFSEVERVSLSSPETDLDLATVSGQVSASNVYKVTKSASHQDSNSTGFREYVQVREHRFLANVCTRFSKSSP